jgi:type I restriction enzyme R subunit
VLFLVDRLELEDQAKKAFVAYLANDYTTVVFKENRDDWRRADIVVSTVQSFLFNNKYRSLFSPTDFDLVISDEAHRSIGGNARAVFDYFIGYKLGLTATPRDYLKKFDTTTDTNDPRELERRLLLDTYRTFGCETGEPTFRYSLLDGVKDGFLINPTKVDARTGITTQLLSEQGFTVATEDESGEEQKETFGHREFEKKFFAPGTNELFCKTFVEGALRDPVSGELGKSIVFAVSQNHAAKLVQIFNQIADRKWPGRYSSDFAIQVTSQVSDAQQFTINFANNKLKGFGNFIPEYKTSKARICVTVGMMTTGYDCPDILNLCLFRPVFSPTEFIQIKGRGTRRHNFLDELHDSERAEAVRESEKTAFKLFDFFANCAFFEEDYDYEQVLELPKPGSGRREGPDMPPRGQGYEHHGEDVLASVVEEKVGDEGMKVDRMFFQRFEDSVRSNPVVTDSIGKGEWDRVLDYVNRELFDKASEYYTLDKLRKAAAVDRRLSLREIIEKAFGLIPRFKTKDELLEEEFQKFVADYKPEEADAIPALKTFFKAYISSPAVRLAIEGRLYANLATNPAFSTRDFKAVPEKYRSLIPQYIRDYVPLNRFTA